MHAKADAPATDPNELAAHIQTALATLADVETRYEIEMEHIRRTCAGPDEAALVERLEARRLAERHPIVQRLAELQQAMTFVLMRRAWSTREEPASPFVEVVVERVEGVWPKASVWSA